MILMVIKDQNLVIIQEKDSPIIHLIFLMRKIFLNISTNKILLMMISFKVSLATEIKVINPHQGLQVKILGNHLAKIHFFLITWERKVLVEVYLKAILYLIMMIFLNLHLREKVTFHRSDHNLLAEISIITI